MSRTIAISGLLAVALLTLVKPSQISASTDDEVYDLAQKCNHGKKSACKDLAKIATDEQDVNIRNFAVYNLTDRSLLAKIVVDDKEERVRVSAAQALNDQSLLAKFAVEDKDPVARQNAVEDLTDLSLLAKIALTDSDVNVRWQANKALAKYLFDATNRGDAAAVQSILDLGVGADLTDEDDFTALMRASMNGHIEVVRVLLAKGANVNASAFDSDYVQMPNGAKAYPGVTTTAAWIASQTGGVVVHGNKNTALSLATANGHQEIAELLVKAGAR
ncbi:MAG: ankyrin repeat domain-containing protein [Terracidiphilus sp.]|jgi:ankyrin repeat protein